MMNFALRLLRMEGKSPAPVTREEIEATWKRSRELIDIAKDLVRVNEELRRELQEKAERMGIVSQNPKSARELACTEFNSLSGTSSSTGRGVY